MPCHRHRRVAPVRPSRSALPPHLAHPRVPAKPSLPLLPLRWWLLLADAVGVVPGVCPAAPYRCSSPGEPLWKTC